MIQEILVGIIFICAILYLGRMLWRNFKPSGNGCAKGCGCNINEEKNDKLIKKFK